MAILFSSKKSEILAHDAESLISIAEKIIRHHSTLGPASPISTSVIASLSSRITSVKEKHHEGMKYKKLMEASLKERDYFLVNGEKDVMSHLKSIYNTLKEQSIDTDSWGL